MAFAKRKAAAKKAAAKKADPVDVPVPAPTVHVKPQPAPYISKHERRARENGTINKKTGLRG